MNSDTVALIAIAASWAGAVGAASLVVAHVLRRQSLRWAFVLVAVCGVVALVAAFVGTARAMFLSTHDFHVVLWVSAVAGLISLAFAVLASRNAVRAASDIQESARVLGDTGRFASISSAPAELAALADQLERAANSLAAARDRERTLEASRRELVAWVSHDLRTPLAGLRAMAEALEDGLVDDPARYHAQMTQTVDRMARMVDDLFELSRIHAGTLQLSLEAVPLHEAIGEALAVSSPMAQSRGVRLDAYAEPGVAVTADSRELGRMILNLVTNAIRHTPSDGIVEVTARAGTSGVELSVSDGCGGIPEDDLGRVFDVAWRGTHARTPGADAGSGLGLAIVRGIAEAHRGSVRVANVGPGCCFVVELPT